MRIRSRARPRQSGNQGAFVTPQACFLWLLSFAPKESNSAVGPRPDKASVGTQTGRARERPAPKAALPDRICPPGRLVV